MTAIVDQPSTWRDTPQQQAILQFHQAAKLTRAMFPQGTRVKFVPKGTRGPVKRPTGTVYRHVPKHDVHGGELIIDWDGGTRGIVTPSNVDYVDE